MSLTQVLPYLWIIIPVCCLIAAIVLPIVIPGFGVLLTPILLAGAAAVIAAVQAGKLFPGSSYITAVPFLPQWSMMQNQNPILNLGHYVTY